MVYLGCIMLKKQSKTNNYWRSNLPQNGQKETSVKPCLGYNSFNNSPKRMVIEISLFIAKSVLTSGNGNFVSLAIRRKILRTILFAVGE